MNSPNPQAFVSSGPVSSREDVPRREADGAHRRDDKARDPDAIAMLRSLHTGGQTLALRAELARWAGEGDAASVTVTRLYGMLLLQWGDEAAALALLQSAATQDAADALLFNDLGTLLYQRRALCAAEAAFGEALRRDASLTAARENAQCAQVLRTSAEVLLNSARQARTQWHLAEAAQLAGQALAIAADLDAAQRLRNGALIEQGDYALAQSLPASLHDARGFDVMLTQILDGSLTVERFPRLRRALAGMAGNDSAPGHDASAHTTLRLGLEAAADDNPPVAIAWLTAWCEGGARDVEAWLGLDSGQRFVVQARAGTQDGPGREALLFELALRIAQPGVAAAAAAAGLRVLRTAGRLRDAHRIEQFLLAENPAFKALLDAMRFVALPTPAQCGPRGRRQTLVLIGTCIAEGVRYVLNLSPAFRARFNLHHFITNRAARSMSEFVIGEALLNDCAVVAHVAPQWADWGNEQAYVDLLARIPPQVERISFPYPAFQPLWPFHCRDNREGQALPAALWRPHEERPYYPYGDSHVLGLMRGAASAGEVVERYLALDLAREIDLDRLLAKTLSIHRDREAGTDVKIVDFIADNFRDRKLFDSINHITNTVALRIANQILARLDIEAVPEKHLERVAEILSPEVPIHPSVRRHFGLRYVGDETRYAVDLYRRLTYAEYLEDYVRFV